VIRFAPVFLLLACGGKGGDKKPPVEPGKDDARVVIVEDASPIVLPPAPPLPGVPQGLPSPSLPSTVTPEAVVLGELLFWDTRLSSHDKLACASCHDPTHGFASGKRMETAEGRPFVRRAPTLVNLAWHKELGWDGRYPSIAEHLEAHMPGQQGIDLAGAVARISEVPGYRAHFARLGGAPSAELAAKALEAYVLTRYEGDSPWDRVERSPDAPANIKAGYQLFQSKAHCSVCHTPPLYTDLRYHRLGLVGSPDEGRGRVDPAKKGAFKTPTLRGAVARQGFFHDASAATLEAAIDWHLAGGLGQGADPAIVDPPVKKVTLTQAEREQLGAFVRALSSVDPMVPPKPTLP
jgi:cytochrome c peroxidase